MALWNTNIRLRNLEANQIANGEARMSALEEHRRSCEHFMHSCDELHLKTAEHNRRHDDSQNTLTQSNILLTEALTKSHEMMYNLSEKLERLIDRVDANQPVIDTGSEVITTWKVNKKIFLTLVGIASGILTLAAAYKFLIG